MAAVRAIAALAREAPSDVAAARLWRRDAALRPGLADPHALRSAPDPAHRAGRREGRDGQRRRHAADRRFRRLSRPAEPLRLPLRLHHEAALRRRRRRRSPSASSMPRARTSACCAPPRCVLEEGIAEPDPDRPPAGHRDARCKRFGLRSGPARDFELINPEDDPRYRDYVATYLELAGRRGITPDAARTLVRTNTTVIARARRRARRGRRDDLRARRPLRARICATSRRSSAARRA